ncbi:MAG TPA: VWA domain-containing protein [Gaiellaceae bacterium]|nr:VWA domain-containing protein [Gaiellaceae bacterium]
MSFARPLFLLALLAVPLAVVLYVVLERRRARYAVAFTNLEVLAAVAGGRPWRRYVPPLLALVALAALAAALARPHVRTTVADERATVILVVDVSASMEAEDVEPTRLAAAQDAIRTFLDRVPDRIRVGLVAFAGDPQVASPPTRDRAFVRGSLDRIAQFPGFSGTAIGDALALAVELGEQATGDGSGPADDDADGETIALRSTAPAPPDESLVSILFLSDGTQTRGVLGPLEGAERARAAGFPVYTVSLGTPEGTVTREFEGIVRTIPVPPDPVTLSEIASATGGSFYEASNAGTLEDVYAKLGSSLGRVPGEAEATAWFLGAAAAALAAALLLGALWAPRLP